MGTYRRWNSNSKKAENRLHLDVGPAPKGISQKTMTTAEFPFSV